MEGGPSAGQLGSQAEVPEEEGPDEGGAGKEAGRDWDAVVME